MMAIIYRFVNSWPDSLESDLNLEITTPHVHALHDWGFVFMIIAQLYNHIILESDLTSFKFKQRATGHRP